MEYPCYNVNALTASQFVLLQCLEKKYLILPWSIIIVVIIIDLSHSELFCYLHHLAFSIKCDLKCIPSPQSRKCYIYIEFMLIQYFSFEMKRVFLLSNLVTVNASVMWCVLGMTHVGSKNGFFVDKCFFFRWRYPIVYQH